MDNGLPLQPGAEGVEGEQNRQERNLEKDLSERPCVCPPRHSLSQAPVTSQFPHPDQQPRHFVVLSMPQRRGQRHLLRKHFTAVYYSVAAVSKNFCFLIFRTIFQIGLRLNNGNISVGNLFAETFRSLSRVVSVRRKVSLSLWRTDQVRGCKQS